MNERRAIIARLGGTVLLLACMSFPAFAQAAAPTIVSATANGTPITSSLFATSSTVWNVIITFDQDITVLPKIIDWDGTTYYTTQAVSSCGSASNTVCFTYTPPAGVPVLTFWHFQVSDAQNAALETMATSSADFLIDTVGPTITLPDFTTKLVLPTVGGTVSEFWHQVTLSITNASLGISRTYTDSAPGGVWSITVPLGDDLPEGIYSMTAIGTDLTAGGGTVIGNSGGAVNAALIVSTSAPGLTITSGPADGGFLGSSTAQFGFSTSSLVSVSTDCSFDNAPGAGCVSPVSSSTLAEGVHTFTATSTDFFGNQTVVNRSFIVDITAPVLTEAAPIATSTNTTPAYSFTSTEAGTLSYGGGCSATTTTIAAGTTTLTFDALSAGTYASCTITATDAAGNTGTLAVSPFAIDAVPVPAPVPSGGGNGVIGGPLSVGFQTPNTAPAAVIPTPPAGTPAPTTASSAGVVAGAATERSNTPHTTAAEVPAAPATEAAPETSSAETAAPVGETPVLGAAAATSGFTLPSWAPLAGFLFLAGGAGWFFLRRRFA